MGDLLSGGRVGRPKKVTVSRSTMKRSISSSNRDTKPATETYVLLLHGTGFPFLYLGESGMSKCTGSTEFSRSDFNAEVY